MKMIADNRLIHFVLFLLLSFPPFAGICAQPVRLGNTDTLLTALVVIAEHEQYFRQEGLNVEVIPLKTGGDGLKGINEGILQLYNASDVTFIKHIHQNEDLKIIASLGEWGNETKLLVHGDSTIHQAGDLRGKKIGVHKGLAFHWFLDLLLRRHGMTENDVEIKFIHAAKQPQALANAEIDAFVSREPFITEAKTLLKDNLRVIEAPNIMMKRFVLITDEKFLSQNKEAATKLLKALVRAESLFVDNPQKAENILMTTFKGSHEDLEKHLKEIRLKINLDNYLLFSLEKVTRWWQYIEGYKTPRDINFLNVIVTEPLSEAKPHGVLMYH